VGDVVGSEVGDGVVVGGAVWVGVGVWVDDGPVTPCSFKSSAPNITEAKTTVASKSTTTATIT
jgi:hypothetical protein